MVPLCIFALLQGYRFNIAYKSNLKKNKQLYLAKLYPMQRIDLNYKDFPNW